MIATTALLVAGLRQFVGPWDRTPARASSAARSEVTNPMQPRTVPRGKLSGTTEEPRWNAAGQEADEESTASHAREGAGVVEPAGEPPVASETASAGLPLVAAPSAGARGLVAGLVKLDLRDGGLTEDGVAAWKRAFQALGESGSAGAAAIQEFLRRSQDYDLARIPGGEELGYSSLRVALFDCLQQIGGDAAQAVLIETLQTTADPREIALLAQSIDAVEPGLHREAAVEAARQSLAMASSGQLPGVDMSPAFEVLQRYGDARVADQLVAASQLWGYYGTLALAGLPDGAGLSALLQLTSASAQGGGGRTEFVWSLLAQVASGNPQAEQLLLEQARGKKIPEAAWPAVAEGLAGFRARFESGVLAGGGSKPLPSPDAKRYHIAVGNQNFVSEPPARMSPDEIQLRTALLEQFLALSPGPTASAVLQQRIEWLGQQVAP